ncbi:hypothetical protein FRC03_003153 [Tulasnella sp. 419]|nr:hypothetical protein FRC03_003153 [Tulasnella sp. 419]
MSQLATIKTKWEKHVEVLGPVLDATLYDLQGLQSVFLDKQEDFLDEIITKLATVAQKMAIVGLRLTSLLRPSSSDVKTVALISEGANDKLEADQMGPVSLQIERTRASDLVATLHNHLQASRTHANYPLPPNGISSQDRVEIEESHARFNELVDQIQITDRWARTERAYLRKKLNHVAHPNFLSRLPPEIISYIIQLLPSFLPFDGKRYNFWDWPVDQVQVPLPYPPLVVSHVSTLLREVTLSTPLLWTRFPIINNGNKVKHASEWLSRSKAALIPILRIAIRIPSAFPVDDAIKLITDHIHHLEGLEMQCHLGISTRFLEAAARHGGSNPQLRYLKLGPVNTRLDSTGVAFSMPNNLGDSVLKNLETLILICVRGWKSWPNCKIRCLKICGGRLNMDSWKIFENCFDHTLGCLEELELWSRGFDDESRMTVPSVDLPVLTTLKVRLPAGPLDDFFSRLRAPSLQSLEISHIYSEQYNIGPLERFLSTTPSLRHVSISADESQEAMSTVALLRILPPIPSLRLVGLPQDSGSCLIEVAKMRGLTTLALEDADVGLADLLRFIQNISADRPGFSLKFTGVVVCRDPEEDEDEGGISTSEALQVWLQSRVSLEWTESYLQH